MKSKTSIENVITEIEKGNILLTKEQKEQLRQAVKKPIYNNNWDKLKIEFKEKIDNYNYTNNNKTVICSLAIQEAIAILLRAKYKVKNVREIKESYEDLEMFTRQVLELIERPKEN